MGVKGFRTLYGSIEKYDYKYLENTPTNLSDFKNDIFGEQRDVFQELKESNFVYDETLSAYIIQIGTKLTWLIADNTVNNVLGYDLVRYNSSLGAYELITEQESPFVVENGVISFENFKIFNGLKPSTTGEYGEVDECWILCNDPNFGEEGYINLFKKYTKGILNMEQVSSLIKITIVTDNWTNNSNYATEDGQFYTDIPITGMTANHSASVIVKGTFENGFFPKAECIEGAIRIYAKLCPISEVMAVVEWGTGDGTAVITTENEDITKYDEHVANANIHVTADEKTAWNNKANKSTISTSTMSASGWSAGVYSFERTYPVATYDIEIALDSTATSEQAEAFNGAQIVGSATSNVVKAYGIVPTVDIPICIKAVMK